MIKETTDTDGDRNLQLMLMLADPLLLSGIAHSDQEYIWLQSEPAAVIQKANAEGHLTVLAHPFRWPEGFEMLQGGMLPDALEYLTSNHNGSMAAESRRAGTRESERCRGLAGSGSPPLLVLVLAELLLPPPPAMPVVTRCL